MGLGLLTVNGITACNGKKEQPVLAENNEGDQPFILDETTITTLQAQMAKGTLTAVQITKLYLNRIDQIDRSGPGLNSVLEVNPDALNIAESLDQERAQKKLRGPLHGIPILLKGNIDTADAMHTNAGASAIAKARPLQDAHLVKLLREAGAIVLGKTNLSEWANFRSTRSSSGWSSVLGQTHNPYVLNCSPCGSSSGSGVAASANLCTVAIGTETDGSIVCPSSTNGIVGLKPTIGLVSRSGIIPISHTCDTAGPMTSSVTDAAILLSVLTGGDESDPAMLNRNNNQVSSDYTLFLNNNGLSGKRIGVARSFFGFHEGVDAIMEQSLQAIKEAGAELIDLPDFKLSPEAYQAQWLVLLYEFKAGVNAYLKGLPSDFPIRTLAQIIEYNNQNSATAMPWFKQEILELAEAKGDLNSQEYLDALSLMKEQAGPQGIDKVMENNSLDALVAPTGSAAWSIDLVNGDHFLGGSSSPAAMAGYPNITVPAGFLHQLPVGISFFGKAFTEGKLLEMAYAFEQRTKVRKKPEFIKSHFELN